MHLTGEENNAAVMKEIGQRIRDTRIAGQVTREEFSEKSGVSVSTLARLESGENVKFDILCSALRALNCLGNVDLLIADQSIIPTQLAQNNGKKRLRAAKKKSSAKKIIWSEDK